jgi:transcriptional regulator with XRE-family HTH domain
MSGKMEKLVENHQFRRRRGNLMQEETPLDNATPAEIDVGRNLHDLRNERGLTIRSLAQLSGLNVNTLSLIENGKTSPSVSTLQQLASALGVPITAFFETNIEKKNISYQKTGQRLQAAFGYGSLADLGAGLTLQGGQPLLVTLRPRASSGSTPIVHTGHEFVFCLEGQLSYTIDGETFMLNPGDSLLFEAHLPHRWQNVGASVSQSLLIMCPSDGSEHPAERHFNAE